MACCGCWTGPDLPEEEPGDGPWIIGYATTNGALFTAIADFPSGSSQPFTVSVAGEVIGSFSPGDSVDFTSLFRSGGGVPEFTVTAIMDLGDPEAFALIAELDIENAEFTITAEAVDTDNDGLADHSDNCIMLANADQRDTNGDGFGNICDADLNNDCVVNVIDLGLMKTVFFTADADADLDGNGSVQVVDLGLMKAGFFAPPGPSGIASDCDGTLSTIITSNTTPVHRIQLPRLADSRP